MDSAHVSQYNRRYYVEHREEIAIRRANKRNVPRGARLTLEEWEGIKSRQQGKCAKCGLLRQLTPFLLARTYIGLCKSCGSKAALILANDWWRKKREEDAEIQGAPGEAVSAQ